MKNMQIAPPKQNFLSILVKYATWLFWLIIILVGLGFYYVGVQVFPSYRDVCISIATSLISSLIFAAIYSAIAEKYTLKATNAELEKSVREAVSDIEKTQQQSIKDISSFTVAKIEEIEKSYFHQISAHFQEFIPVEYFPPTSQPDKRFNDALNSSLLQSQQYLFKGTTGRYVPSRLEIAKHQIHTCRVLLVDPTHDQLLYLYVRDRFGNVTPDTSMREEIKKVQQEIYMTVVDLFTQAHRWCNVELRMFHGPVFYRLEIFDERLFVSYYSTQIATAYPSTYVYNRGSFFYNVFTTDYSQTFDLSSKSIQLSNRSTEEDLKDFLKLIGCDPATLPQLRKEAEAFRHDFISRYC
jgi:hypothetical protein